MPRGSNFSEAEEIPLCTSYLKIGEDARTGTDQASATFWKRIHEHFSSARPEGSATREIRSLECKWSKISAQVKLFSDAMDRVERRSGASFEDEVRDAHSIYMIMEDRDGVTPANPFKLLHCWRILRTEPLWASYRGGSESGTAINEQSSEGVARVSHRQGRKAKKEETKAAASTSASIAELAKANKEVAAASKKHARTIQDASDVALFTVSLADLDPDSRRFFELRRRQVLARLEKAVDAGGGIAADEEATSGAITNGDINVQDVEDSSTPAAA